MERQEQKPIPEKPSLTLNQARDILRVFAKERDWEQFHTPRNLMLALVGQVGELAEIFQWKGEVPNGLQGFHEAEKIHLGEELADVFNYLVRLADVCGVDLNQAYLDKMAKNKAKYPAEQVKGSAKKYIEYKQEHRKKKMEQSNEEEFQ